MTTETAEAQREQARAWARARLAEAPWAELATRATLLLVSPPRLDRPLPAEAPVEAWLALERAEVRVLPSEHRGPLQRHGARRLEAPEGTLTVVVAEGLPRLVTATTRAALEARWRIGHAEPLHDPLRRHETLALQALLMPPDDPVERIVRPLYVQLAGLFEALPAGGVAVLGEATAVLARILCVVETGIHPPPEWLIEVARHTELGARLQAWFEDAPRAAGGDEAALRRLVTGRPALRRMLDETLKHHLGAPDWLVAPAAYALRPPR